MKKQFLIPTIITTAMLPLTSIVSCNSENITVTILGGESQKIFKNQTEFIYCTWEPSSFSAQTVSWTAKDSSILRVERSSYQSTTLTGLKAGQTTLTVDVTDKKGNHFKDTCEVVVEEAVPETIEINEGDHTCFHRNSTRQLTYKVNPEYAQYDGVTWSSSNEEIATVEDGLVTTKDTLCEEGVTITVKINNTEIQDSILVKVVNHVPIEKINVFSEGDLELGGSVQLHCKFYPQDTDDTQLFWWSTHPWIAEVDQNGYVWSTGEKGYVAINVKSKASGREDVQDNIFFQL